MPLGDLIGSDQVVAGLRVADKGQLLAELSRRAAAALSLPQSIVLQALLAREQLGSTGLGRGFALPHARLPQLSRVYALLARLARPIDYEAVDEKPVDLVVLLLTPESAANQHLATLAALSRPFREEAFVAQVRKAPDAAGIWKLLASPA
ncbi:MAG TPA: PTS sugar transporter subunit IIA [Acetobacteraceae bacterium]|nr:PTS sugar transporter subunit IIA [Acetobacteraceae bacterium]